MDGRWIPPPPPPPNDPGYTTLYGGVPDPLPRDIGGRPKPGTNASSYVPVKQPPPLWSRPERKPFWGWRRFWGIGLTIYGVLLFPAYFKVVSHPGKGSLADIVFTLIFAGYVALVILLWCE